VLIGLSPPVWPGADTVTTSPLGSLGLENPAIFCIPLGFIGCFVGTLLGHERETERTYHELYVRSETGLGAEAVGDGAGRLRPRARRGAARRGRRSRHGTRTCHGSPPRCSWGCGRSR
jgi:hypothetical protein